MTAAEPAQAWARGALLTVEEAADLLNVPPRWLSDAVRSRTVRCTRIGKHIRFRMEHLEELIAAGEQPVVGFVDLPAPRSRAGRSRL